jgi:uncharacterized protein (DUF3820 family)
VEESDCKFSGGVVLLDSMPWGRFKGAKLTNVSTSYFHWLLRTVRGHDALKTRIIEILADREAGGGK